MRYKGSDGATEHPDKGFMEISRDIVDDDPKLARVICESSQKHHAYTKFNMQRVDLILA